MQAPTSSSHRWGGRGDGHHSEKKRPRPAAPSEDANEAAARALRDKLAGNFTSPAPAKPPPPQQHQHHHHHQQRKPFDEEHATVEELAAHERSLKSLPKAMPSLQQRRHQSDSDDEYGDFAAAAVPPTKRKPKTTTTQQHQRSRTEDAAAAAPCFLCGEGRQRLMLSLGEAVFLSLPARGSLCEGHCVLATVQHTPSFREADAAAQKELKRFKAALVEMFRMQRRGVVFIERRARRPTHAAVEAVPLPLELSEEAPAFFKQALLQADEEWAQHKKIIDTAAERGGIATAVPCEFPYFHVEFDDGHGFAHVIEDDAKVPWHFGRSVLAGMLELPPTVFLKPRARPSAEEERRDVKRFLDEWAAFDWTSELEGGEYL